MKTLPSDQRLPSSATLTADSLFIHGMESIEMVVALAPYPIVILNTDGRILRSNRRFIDMQPAGSDLRGLPFTQLISGRDQQHMQELLRRCRHIADPLNIVVDMVGKGSEVMPFRWTIQGEPSTQLIFCYGELATARDMDNYRNDNPAKDNYDAIARLERKLLEQLASRSQLPVMEIVDSLLVGIEALYPGTLCSILRLSPDKCLAHYSAPNLPSEYTRLINGAKPGARAGSCGTAVFLDKTVIVSDLETDPLWENYRDLALPFGLRSCWSVPIHYSSGEILGVFGIYHRHPCFPSEEMMAAIERLANLIGLVIENREMMDRLLLSNERYKLSSMATHDLIWDWDIRKDEIFRNEEGLMEVYGFANNDPILKIDDWVGRVHAEDRERVKNEIKENIYGDKQSWFEVEFRFIRGDGQVVHIHDRAYIMRDMQGNAVRVIGAAQDITQRIRAEQLVRDSEQRYRHLFLCSPLPMWVFDLETHRFLEVNQKAVQHYGYSKEEFLGMTIYDIRSVTEQQRLRKILQKRKEGQKTYLHGKFQHRKKNGELIYVNIFSHILRYKDQDTMLVLANDITEKIILQDQLIKAKLTRQKEITQATIGAQEKERNEIGTELHDNVNQLLTSAKLYFECVGRYDENQEEYRSTGVSLIAEAIEEIRKLSKTLVQPRLHDIGLLRSIDDLLANLSDTSSVLTDFRYDGFVESSIDNGLKLTIYRISQEQITNIVKHAGASHVCIVLTREGDYLKFSIRDNGKGYDTAAHRTGVGLSSIRNRAAMHQGVVSIESAPGQGFSLHVSFHLAGAPNK